MANKNQDKLELGFPVYAVAYSEATSVLYVAGGGGPAKSGVRNCLISYKYCQQKHELTKLDELSCGQEAPMCLAVHPKRPDHVVLGVNDRCWSVEIDDQEQLSLAKSVKTDFCKSDAYQRIVRFSGDGKEILTVGNDENIRVWDFPDLGSKFKVPLSLDNLKKSRMEDLDCDNHDRLIAIATSSTIQVHERKSHQLVASLAAKPGYVFRGVRFIGTEPQSLVTIENSTSRHQPLLSLWCTKSWTRRSSSRLPARLRVTTLSVAGDLIALGAADGTVAVYDAQLKKSFFQKELHKFIVTSLAISNRGPDYTLFSGSGDGTVRIVRVPRSSLTSVLLLLILLMLIVAAFSLVMYLRHV